MFKRTKVSAGVLAALGGVLVFGASPAFAQGAGERVEITGSRLKSFEVESASPIVTLGAETIKVEGVRNVETLLNNLPQVFADQGAQVSNGSTGASTVNLRNLGSTRTLVLVNGRRLPAGDPRDVSADLTQIPISLIKRVELLTGGASAVYGSDAVAGVVNFILDDRFSGIQVDINTQFYNHKQKGNIDYALAARNYAKPGNKDADGQVHDFNLTMGSNFDGGKGNAVLFFGYKKEQALLESERDFSACALAYSRATNKFSCGGSGTSYPGRFTDLSSFDLTLDKTSGAVRNYVGSTDAYNFAPLNYFQRPSERFVFTALGHYDINESVRPYTELSWMDNRTVAQIAPSGIFGTAGVGGGSLITASFDNPLITQDWKNHLGLTAPGQSVDMYVFRRNVEGGGRRDDLEHSSYRAVMGVKGDVGNWSYDASAQYGRVLFQQTYFNDFSNIRILRATDVVADANGNPICRSVADGTDPNCVPYNIWSVGGVTPAALAYLQTPLFSRGFTSQSILSASVSGDLGGYGIKSPLAKNGLSIAAGLEHRLERLEFNTDENFTSGNGAGQGGPTIGVTGSYSVKDGFVEARLPLIEKSPFAELLSINGSYRRSSYSTGQHTNTYGLGLEYAPISMVKLRGSYQRAARAANVIELYSAQSLGLYDNAAGDPCAGAAPTASQAQCALTGVSAAQYGHIAASPAGQYNQITGGNPDLKPETAKSFTLGILVNPIKELTIGVDYFSIKIDDIINNAPSTQILANCLSTGSPQLCGLVHRDTAGTLWASPNAYILSTNANLSVRETSGLDIVADYQMKTPMGAVGLSYIGTVLRKYESEDFPGSGRYDCAGLFGDTCEAVGNIVPKYRHKVRTSWETPWDAGLALTWRYIAKVTFEGDNSNPVLAGGSAGQVPELAARNYFDIAASYNVTKNVTVRAVVNNVFDKDPPLRTNGSGFINGNTYPVMYDALGRKIGLNLTAKF